MSECQPFLRDCFFLCCSVLRSQNILVARSLLMTEISSSLLHWNDLFEIGWMCIVESAGLPVSSPSFWQSTFWRSLVSSSWARKKTTPRCETVDSSGSGSREGLHRTYEKLCRESVLVRIERVHNPFS